MVLEQSPTPEAHACRLGHLLLLTSRQLEAVPHLVRCEAEAGVLSQTAVALLKGVTTDSNETPESLREEQSE